MGATREWILRNPSGQEMVVRLEPGQSVTVGRDLTSDLPILDAGVSRHHATLTLERDDSGQDTLWIEDLHSHNGTFVNTEPVQRSAIQNGDVITFGRVAVTVTERKGQDEALDPLGKLSPERLALLVRVARDFAGDQQQPMIYQRLLELAVEALDAERGAVLLWEEKREVFHPVAAHPRSLFQEVSSLLPRRLAQTILHGGSARLLWPDLGGTGVTLEPARDLFASASDRGVADPIASARHDSDLADAAVPHSRLHPAPHQPTRQAPGPHQAVATAVATPLLSSGRPVGILYLDRAALRTGFHSQDGNFLFALAWVTNATLGASSQISDMRSWNQRLEALIARDGDEGLDRAALGSAFGHGRPAGADESSKLIGELERYLEATIRTVRAASAREKLTAELLECALAGAMLRARAVRRLSDRASARLEEVQVGHAIREAGASLAGRVSCRVATGRELSVFCSPEEFLLAVELALDVVGCPRSAASGGRGAGAPEEAIFAPVRLHATATPAADGSAVHLRILLPAAEPARPASAVEDRRDGSDRSQSAHEAETGSGGRDLATISREGGLLLLRRIARERLRGDLVVEEDGAGRVQALELHLPQVSVSLNETAILPPHRFPHEALSSENVSSAAPEGNSPS